MQDQTSIKQQIDKLHAEMVILFIIYIYIYIFKFSIFITYLIIALKGEISHFAPPGDFRLGPPYP